MSNISRLEAAYGSQKGGAISRLNSRFGTATPTAPQKAQQWESPKAKADKAKHITDGLMTLEQARSRGITESEWLAMTKQATERPELTADERTGVEYWRDQQSAPIRDFNAEANSYLESFNRFVDSANQDRQALNYDNAATVMEGKIPQAEELRRQAERLQAFVQTNRGKLSRKEYEDLTQTLVRTRSGIDQIMSGLGSNVRHISSFASKEEYEAANNAALEQQKAYEKQMGEDVSALDAEIRQLEAVQQEFRQLTRYVQTAATSASGDAHNRMAQIRSQYGDLDALLSKKRTYRNQVAQLQELARLEGLAIPGSENYDPEFAEKSKYVSTANGTQRHWLDLLFDNYSNGNSGWDDPLYEYINGNAEAGAWLSNQAASGATGLSAIYARTAYSPTEVEQMEPNEVGIFNYLYATQGKEAAHQYYYDYLQPTLYARQRQSEEDKWAKYAEKDPVGSSIGSILTSPLKGLSYAGQAMDYLTSGSIDQNAPYNRFAYTNSAIREQVAKDIERSGKWGKVGSFTYQLGMSMGDFLMSTAVSGGNSAMSLAIMGTGAAADTTIAAKDRGLSDTQAFWLGTAAGATEIITEKIGLDALLDTALMSKSAAAYFLKNALGEGLEEGLADVFNLAADVLISKDKSEWAQAIATYREQDMSEEEAFRKVFGEQLLAIGIDMLGGALSGSALGSVGSISAAVRNQKTGRKIVNAGGVDVLRSAAGSIATEIGGREGKALSKLSGKVSSEVSTGTGLGRITAAFRNASNAQRAGALYSRTAAVISERNIGDIADSLTEQGFPKKKAASIAEAVELALEGGSLSEQQQSLLESLRGSDAFLATMTEMLGTEDSPVLRRLSALTDVMIPKATAAEAPVSPEATPAVVSEDAVTDSTDPVSEAADVLRSGSTAVPEDSTVSTEGDGDWMAPFLTGTGEAAAAERFDFDNVFRALQSARDSGTLTEERFTQIIDKMAFAQADYAEGNITEDAYQRILRQAMAQTGTATDRGTKAETSVSATDPLVDVRPEEWEMAQRLAKALGRDIVFYNSTRGDNGYFKDGTIFVNILATDPLAQIISHELTHSLENTKEYSKLKKFVFRRLAQRNITVEQARKAKYEQYKAHGVILKTADDMDAEIVAEYVQNYLLSDEASIQALVAEEPSVARQIWNFLKNLLQRLLGDERAELEHMAQIYAKALKESRGDRAVEGSVSRAEPGAMNPLESTDDLDRMRERIEADYQAGRMTDAEYDAAMDVYDEAEEDRMAASVEEYSFGGAEENTAGGGARYSLRNYSEKQIKNWESSRRIIVYESPEQLEKFISDSITNKTMDKKMYFGAISNDLANAIFRETGLNLENYNLSLSSYEVRKTLKDHGDEQKEALRGQRAVLPTDFAHIVDIVLNPSQIVLSDMLYNGKPAIVFTGENDGRMNVVAVVSGRRLDLFVQTVYINVKKGNLATPIGEQAPINTPEASSSTVSSDEIIHNPSGNVNSDNQDELYEDAVQRGDMAAAEEMLRRRASEQGYSSDSDWRMNHQAPNSETGVCVADADTAYGGDGSIYSPLALRYYGEGRSYDRKAIMALLKVRESPEATITVYRAVPSSIQATKLQNGDWVAPTKEYAQEHGEAVLNGDFRIVAETVPARHLYLDGNSIHEWGYDNGSRDEVYGNAPGNVKRSSVTYDDDGNLIPLSRRYDRENTDVRYSFSQEKKHPLTPEKYNELLRKKPIKVSRQEFAMIKSQRKSRYAGLQENDIPTIDFFRIGDYVIVNNGFIYCTRNFDSDNFVIISKKKIKAQTRRITREVVDNGEYGPDAATDYSASEQGSKRGPYRSGSEHIGNGGELLENDRGNLSGGESLTDVFAGRGTSDSRPVRQKDSTQTVSGKDAESSGDADTQFSFSDAETFTEEEMRDMEALYAEMRREAEVEGEKRPEKSLAEFMGDFAPEAAKPWRQGSIVDDEQVKQAHRAGFPVIDGVQIIPFVTWVHCTDPYLDEDGNVQRRSDGSIRRRSNYGLVTGRMGDMLLVSFNNKGAKPGGAKAGEVAEGKKNDVPISIEYLKPVRGKYQETLAEFESREYSEPVTWEELNLTEEEEREIQAMYDRSRIDEEVIPIDIGALPRKARNYLERVQRKLLAGLCKQLGVPRMAAKERLQSIVEEITTTYLTDGYLPDGKWDELFDKAYAQGIVADREFFDMYKEVKDVIRTTAITLSDRDKADIADYGDWRKRQFGRLRIVNEGGLPVDSFYEELRSMAPELFPEEIMHPADQLVQIAEVAKSIAISKKTLDEFYGPEAAEFREWARHDFTTVVSECISALSSVRRYAEERAAKAAREPAPATPEEAMEAFKKLKKARRTYERARAKHILTEHDEVLVGRLLRHEMELDQLKPGEDNVPGITAVYEAKVEYEELCKLITTYKRHLHGKLRTEADSYLETAGEWKDKTLGIAYSRETMRRNIYDIIPDKTLARQINEAYFEPVHDAEAQAVRLKDKYRNMVRDMGLSTKVQKGNLVSEAHAVQLLGEAEDNIRILEDARGRMEHRDGKTLAEWRAVVAKLWDENPGLEKARIRNAVEQFRSIYDELFIQMNRVCVENGYEPINYRSGYFPHFQPGASDGVLARFGLALGIDTKVVALPTTISGLTHTFRPGIQWFGHAQERLGFNTAYDAVEGFDRYIEGAASVICQTANIQRLRAFATQVRYRASDEGIREQIDAINEDPRLTEEEKRLKIQDIYEHGKFALANFVAELDEYTNLLANKKSKHDRSIEALMGRKIYAFLKAWESRVGANMVAGNISSALTNFIPLTQAAAQMDKRDFIRGMWQTLVSLKTDDGLVGVSTFLTNRRGSDPLIRSWSQKAAAVVGKPMEFIDQFVSGAVVRGAYYQGLRRGLSESEAMHQADVFAASVMADRSKGSMPTLMVASNPLFKMFTQFQLEVNNQFSEIFKDLPRNHREKGIGAFALVLFQYFLGAWLFNELYEKLFGRRPALDPIGIIIDTAKDFADPDVGFGEGVKNLTSDALSALPFSSGLTMFGIETDGGRIPASSAVPDLTALWDAATEEGWSAKKRWKEIQDELMKLAYVAPPFLGGQVLKSIKGLRAFALGGSYTVDSKGEDVLQYPIYRDNPWAALGAFFRTAVFGKNSVPEAQEWVDSGFNSFTAKQTAVYDAMVEAGTSARDSFMLLCELRDAQKTETQSQRDVQRQILLDSEVSGDGKAIAYYGILCGEKEGAAGYADRLTMDALLDMGADAWESAKALINIDNADKLEGADKTAAKYDAIIQAALTDEEKSVLVGSITGTEMLTDSGNLTQWAKFKAAIECGMDVDEYLKYRKTGADIDDYLEFSYAGIDSDIAMDMAQGLDALEPEEGVEKVKDIQRWRVAVDCSDDVESQLTSLYIIMDGSKRYQKLEAAVYHCGVAPESFVSLYEALPKFDDGNGSYTQAEITAAINGMKGLTVNQKAALWQIAVSSTSAKKNPYSTSVGQSILDALTRSGGDEEGTSFEEEIMRQWGLKG